MKRFDVFFQEFGYAFLSVGLFVMVIGGWLMLSAHPAGAFCFANESDARVFVRAELSDRTGKVGPVLR